MADTPITTGDVNITINYPERDGDEHEHGNCGCGCGCNPCNCGCQAPSSPPASPKVTVIQKHYHAGACCPPVAPVGFHNQIWGTHASHCPGEDSTCVEINPDCPEK